jgi:hypothetical protein
MCDKEDHKEEKKMPAAMREKPRVTGSDAERFAKRIRENNKKMEKRLKALRERENGRFFTARPE